VEKSGDNVTQADGSVNQPTGPGGVEKGHLIKTTAFLGGMTLISRFLGMARDVLCAGIFGTSWQWDGFIYAFMIPNFFRRLVGEGALSSVFIPVYTEIREKSGKEEAFRFANVTLTVVGCFLLGFLLVMEALMTLCLNMLALPETVTLILSLLRILFPYLWFISIFAIGMGILNSHRHFFAPSLAPIIINVTWIVGILWLVPLAGTDKASQLHFLAGAILFSGILFLAFEFPFVKGLGFRLTWAWDLFYPGIVKGGKLLLPVILGFAVIQVNILVDMTLGMVLGPGANSSLWYGTRLMQFPLGIFAVAMGTALLPMISKHAVSGDWDAQRQSLSFALRSVFLIVVPCAVGLIFLSREIVSLLFERGAFDAISTARTAAVLVGYSVGLFAYSGQKILITGFFAVQNSKTPMKIGIAAVFINLFFNLILMYPLKEAGLALATAISGIVQFGLLIFFYQRKIADLPLKELFRAFVKILLAALIMACMGILGLGYLKSLLPGADLFSKMIHVFGAIFLSILIYLIACWLLRVHEVREAFQYLRGRRSSSGGATVQ